jgi:hypothetical protein
VPLLQRLRWQPSTTWAVAFGLLAIVAILMIDRSEEFIYFQF